MKQIRVGQMKSTELSILYINSFTIIIIIIIIIHRTIRCIHFETYEIIAIQPGISILAKYYKQERNTEF